MLLRNEELIKMECGDMDLKKVNTLGNLGIKAKDKAAESIKAALEKTEKEKGGEVDPVNKLLNHNVVGYYLSKYFSPQIEPGVYDIKTALLIPDSNAEAYAKSSPCEGSSGFFSQKAQLMMICKAEFKLKSLKQAIKDQSYIKEQSNMDGALNSEKTAGFTFLHETLHWVNPGST